MSTWLDVINADLSEARPKLDPVPDGTYKTVLVDANPTTFRSGSQGIEVKFAITEGPHEGRWLFEKYVTRLASGEINKFGTRQAKEFLAAGLSAEELSKFRAPDFKKGLKGDLVKLLEKPFIVTIKNRVETKGLYAGKNRTCIETVAGV